MNPAFNLRNPVLLLVAGVAFIVLLASTLAVVPETRQALVVRFGTPVQVVNGYQPGETSGRSGAGLIVRVPFLDQLVWVDKRLLDVDMDRQQLMTADQHRLGIDAFAHYRIVDPLRMYRQAGSERAVADRLRPLLGAAIRDAVEKRTADALLSGNDRAALVRSVQGNLGKAAASLGAEIVDVRIRRIDLPEGAPLQSALDRMKRAREDAAQAIDAEGRRQAQIIRADADAQAARIYADSFGKDADFYAFYRAMQSYRRTLGGDGSQTNMVLSPNNAYLREFGGRGR